MLFLVTATLCAADDDGRDGDDGHDMEDVRLEWPLGGSAGQVIRAFGLAVNPETGDPYLHDAVDIAALAGTPVICPFAGVVTSAGMDAAGPAGAFVVLEHEDGEFRTVYRHLQTIEVNEGDSLDVGDRIGTVGNTGATSDYALGLQMLLLDETSADPLWFLQDSLPPQVREWYQSQNR